MFKFNLSKPSQTIAVTETNDLSSIERVEQEKMTRRAALRHIGLAGGMAVLGTLTIDDLARVSAKKLEQYELTRGIAQDFKSAGVAFAQDEHGHCPSGDWKCVCDQIYNQDVITCGNGAGCDSIPGLLTPACIAYNLCMWQARSDQTNCSSLR